MLDYNHFSRLLPKGKGSIKISSPEINNFTLEIIRVNKYHDLPALSKEYCIFGSLYPDFLRNDVLNSNVDIKGNVFFIDAIYGNTRYIQMISPNKNSSICSEEDNTLITQCINNL